MIKRFFYHNWQRKVVALFAAAVIWLFVNHSIIDTKTIPLVPIRVINLPPGKTAIGLGANGTLGKRVTLTLTGTKDVIDKLEIGDIELHVDASDINYNEWVLHFTKKNLVSLNPSLNLANHITQIQHNEYILRLSKLVSDKIPVTITAVGEAPPGYEFQGVWPEQVMLDVTGPEKEIREIKNEGLEFEIALSDITKEELDKLQKSQNQVHNDEICYYIPDKWKSVAIPFYKNQQVKVLQENIRIDFLRKELLVLEQDLPIRVFYPYKTLDKLNPDNYPLKPNEEIKVIDHLTYLSLPIYVSNVSQLFLDLIRYNIEIAVVAALPEEREMLPWSLQIINPQKLEDTYVAYWMSNLGEEKNESLMSKKNETLLRQRFRNYMQKLTLHTDKDHYLNLHCTLDDKCITVNVDK